jgi:predicted 3-demethylubiquinone-9 3-methyltransferase (glyoxalase superfamily)
LPQDRFLLFKSNKRIQAQVNPEVVLAGLEDAEKFDHLSDRWGIDFEVLINKIKSLSVAGLYFLQEEIDRFWNEPSAYGAPSPDLELFLDKFTE